MKKVIILSITFLVASSVIFAQSKAGKTDTLGRSTYYYTCPMHPDYMTDKAGSCPVCGMKLNLSLKEEMKTSVTKNYTCPVCTWI